MKTSYQNHPAHTNQKFTPQFVRAQRVRPVGAGTQPALFVAAPARTLRVEDIAEVKRSVAIARATPQPGETVASLVRDLSEQMGVPVAAIMSVVRSGWRP